jgi:hypothetical protein
LLHRLIALIVDNLLGVALNGCRQPDLNPARSSTGALYQAPRALGLLDNWFQSRFVIMLVPGQERPAKKLVGGDQHGNARFLSKQAQVVRVRPPLT